MADDLARAQRKEVELLQGRVKEAKHDLTLPHREGFPEELQALVTEAATLEAELSRERAALRSSQQALARAQHDAAEVERLALVPKTLRSAGAGVFAIVFAGSLATFWAMGSLLDINPDTAHLVGLSIATGIPPVVLAWLLRRRFNGDGTFRNPS